MNRQSFIIGAIILVVASFFNRIIGFIYRVWAVRIVGAEGIGLYEMVFPVYIMVLVITTAGIPYAISKLVSTYSARGNMAAAIKIFKISLLFLFASGIFFSISMYALYPILKEYAFPDPRVGMIFKTMIPAIFFISVSSAFRGFFQGMQQMVPTAITQTVEQLVRVFVGLAAAGYMMNYGLEYAVTGLALGMVAGELVGLIVVVVIYYFKGPRLSLSGESNLNTFDILKDIHRLSVPITFTRVLASIIMAIEAMMLPKRLQVAGLTVSEAATVYGQYSGMALSLLVLPTVLTISLTVTLTPAISEAVAQNNRYLISSLIHKSLKLTILIGIYSGIIFYSFGPELTKVLFNNADAGNILRFLAVGCIFLYLQQTTMGVLQGLGEVKVIFFNSLIGGTVRLIGIYYLTSIPQYGIYGALLTLIVSFVIMAFLNIISISKITGLNILLQQHLFRPLCSGAILFVFIKLLVPIFFPSTETLLFLVATIAICGLVYITLLLMFKVISINSVIKLLTKKS